MAGQRQLFHRRGCLFQALCRACGGLCVHPHIRLAARPPLLVLCLAQHFARGKSREGIGGARTQAFDRAWCKRVGGAVCVLEACFEFRACVCVCVCMDQQQMRLRVLI